MRVVVERLVLLPKMVAVLFVGTVINSVFLSVCLYSLDFTTLQAQRYMVAFWNFSGGLLIYTSLFASGFVVRHLIRAGVTLFVSLFTNLLLNLTLLIQFGVMAMIVCLIMNCVFYKLQWIATI